MDSITRDALAWVNSIREQEGKPTLAEMPEGDVGQCETCPIAQALGYDSVNVTANNAFIYDDDSVFFDGYTEVGAVELPTQVKEFIIAFDSLDYPDLIAA